MAGAKATIEINANAKGVKKGVKEAKRSVGNLGKAIQVALGLSFHTLASRMVGLLKTIAVESVKVHARFERLGLTFRKLLSSDLAGKELMGQLREFSVKTPFEPEDVFKASKQLLAFGIVAKDQVKTLRMLGDAASVSGKPLEELAFLYGKVFSRGRAQAREMNQLIRAQIPITREVAKVMGVAESQVAKLTEEGKVGFEVIKKALENLTGAGGQFFNMTTEHAKTLEGRWSTLVGVVKDLADAMAKVISPQTKSALELLIKAAESAKEIVQGLGHGDMKEAERRIFDPTLLEELRDKKSAMGLNKLEEKALKRLVELEQQRLRIQHKKKKAAMTATNALLKEQEASKVEAAKAVKDPRAAVGLFTAGRTMLDIPQMQLEEARKTNTLLEEIKNRTRPQKDSFDTMADKLFRTVREGAN